MCQDCVKSMGNTRVSPCSYVVPGNTGTMSLDPLDPMGAIGSSVWALRPLTEQRARSWRAEGKQRKQNPYFLFFSLPSSQNRSPKAFLCIVCCVGMVLIPCPGSPFTSVLQGSCCLLEILATSSNNKSHGKERRNKRGRRDKANCHFHWKAITVNSVPFAPMVNNWLLFLKS